MIARVLLRRLVLALVTVWLAATLVFIALQALPGNLATQILGQDATPEAVASLNEKFGLNRPATERYVDWLAGAVQGDFGDSMVKQKPVVELVGQGLRNSGLLAGIVILAGITLSLVLGVITALFEIDGRTC